MVAFDWDDLPVGREFDGKFFKTVKSPPYALPPPPRLNIDRCIIYMVLQIMLVTVRRARKHAGRLSRRHKLVLRRKFDKNKKEPKFLRIT